MLGPLCAALLLTFTSAAETRAGPSPRVARPAVTKKAERRAAERPRNVQAATPRKAHAAKAPKARPAAPRSARRDPARAIRPAPSKLAAARAELAAVKRDPAKRRYRSRWEHAIRALEAAARGPDRAPALLDAARARYALYRFSQVDADRSAALRLADRARRAGAHEADAFASAVRKEMEGPPARRRDLAPDPSPARPSPEEEDDDERSPSHDPALKKALAVGDDEEAPRDTAEDEAEPPPRLERGPARLTEVRSWTNGAYTRVALYLSREVDYTEEELIGPAKGAVPAAGKRGARASVPRRQLALELDDAQLSKALARIPGGALVARLRAAPLSGGRLRVLLDLGGREGYSVVKLQDPARLIVDLGARDASRQEVAELRRRSEGGSGVSQRSRAEARGWAVRRVVVDAGHGGHDAGAVGPTGVREKDVTLAMAKRLAGELRGRGFEVVLTRDDDRYVPLEERTAIANGRRADLFVSLHANAHPRRDQRGVETWVLDAAHGRYARRLAARENGALRDDDDGRVVRRVLADLDARQSAAASQKLATLVQDSLTDGLRSHVGEVRDLGVKSALFHVLVGARMPALLVETAFISNREEERRLASPRYQAEVARAIAAAVEKYARSGERVARAG